MVRNSPAYPRTYFQPMLKIEQQWKPAKEKEGSGAGLQCGTQPPQSWPPWANFTNIAGLEDYFWQFLLSEIEENGTQIPKVIFSLIFRYHHLWESARERLSQWVKEDKLQVHSMCYIILLFDIEISSIEKCCWSSSHFIRLEKSLNISNVTEMVKYI